MTSLADLSSEARALLEHQTIEVPSWAYGNSGTRFKVFGSPGTPRNPYEKIADAAQVNRFTGHAPRVSLHIPWDKVDDYSDLAGYARDHGVTIGMINSNVFQDDDYKLGSLCNPDAGGAAEGGRPPPRVHRDHAGHRQPRTEDLAGRRAQLSRSGRPALAPGAAGRGPPPGVRRTR